MVWTLYTQQLHKRPLLTQALMSGVLFGLGDLIAQQAVERKGLSNHEWTRTARLALYGTAVAGPFVVGWYNFMERYIRHGNVNIQTVLRVAADQAIISPVFMTVFFTYNSLLSGQSIAQAKETLDQKFWPTLINGYKLWPMVQLVNFYFVPLNHRLLVVNSVALGWNAYLAYVANAVPPLDA